MAKPAKKAPAKKTAAKAEKPAKEKIVRESQNDVTKPKDGTTTGRVWAIADEISKAQKRPATRGEVMEKATGEDIAEATVATQYQRWRTFHGHPRSAPAPKAEKPAKAAKAPAKKAPSKKAASAAAAPAQ